MAQMSGVAVSVDRSIHIWGAGSVGLSDEHGVMREAGGRRSNHCFSFGQSSGWRCGNGKGNLPQVFTLLCYWLVETI